MNFNVFFTLLFTYWQYNKVSIFRNKNQFQGCIKMETKSKTIEQFIASLGDDYGQAYKSTAAYIHKFLEALKKDGYSVVLSKSSLGEIPCTTSLEALEAISDAHSATIILRKGRVDLSIDFTFASDNEESVTDYGILLNSSRTAGSFISNAFLKRIDEIRDSIK